MERCVPRFRWYRAFRIIMLILAILLALGAVLTVVAMTFFRMAALQESPPANFVAWLDALRVLVYQCLTQVVFFSLLFFATFVALRMKRRIGIYLVLAQNVLLPVSSLLYIPITTTYFRAFAESMRQFADGALTDEIAVFTVMINTVVPVSCVITAVVTALILIPNSIYFYKRRDFIHLEDVSV